MNLLKAAFSVSAFTLLSRVTGLVRDSISASLFGTSAMMDAFQIAFRIPNLLRRFFAEGAFSQAFIPLSGRPYLVVVAGQGEFEAKNLRAFLAGPQQGVNYHKGCWHHYSLALEAMCRTIERSVFDLCGEPLPAELTAGKDYRIN